MSTFIKKCREEAGLTQAQLAEKMDVSVVAVQTGKGGKQRLILTDIWIWQQFLMFR